MPNLYVSEGSLFLATITVTYPSGATCTIENYKQTYTAPDTSGSWKFCANEAGYYTVTRTASSKTVSQQVAIWKQGENTDVDLDYKYIFKSGEGGKVPITSIQEDGSVFVLGMSQITISSTTTNACSTFYTASPIDISQYDYLKIEYNATSSTYPLKFGLMSSEPNNGNSYSEKWYISTEGYVGGKSLIFTVSNLTGSYYVVGTAAGEATITNIWFE